MSTFGAYKTVLPYIKKYWRQYCGGLLCLLVIIAGQLAIPQFIRLSIDTLGDEATDVVRVIIRAMAQMVGVTLIIAIARFGWRHFLAITARKIETELRHDLYTKLTTLSHDFYSTHSTGDVIARLTNDLRAIRMACGFAIVSIVDGLVMGMAIIIVLLSRYPQLTIYMLAPLAPISILVFMSGKIIMKRYTRVQQAFSVLTEKVRHTFTNMKTIKVYGKEQYFAKQFNHYADQYRHHSLHYARYWTFIYPAVLFLATCSNLLLIIFGGRQVIRGQISIGDFTAIMTYLEMLLWPMIGLGFTINLFSQGAASLERVNAFLHAKPLIESAKRTRALGREFGVVIENLHYTYPNTDARVLRDISLNIPSAAHIGIIGRTASGKSTLAQIFPRMLEAPPHTISVDGHDIRRYNLEELRKNICLIPQQPFLFSASIEHNIRFGNTDADAQYFAQIIEAAAIDVDSPEFTIGLDTEIGENGIMISGGQKQRVAIARALLVDPPMVIFDDTFSALDAETEQQVLRQVRQLRTGKTTVYISNRVQSIQHCDKIYVLNDGEIIQQGGYQELIEKAGLLQDLYHLQVPMKLRQ